MDDGTPLGREGAGACAIDSLSQSFAVLCGLNASHTGTALDTALRQLEDGENGLLKLFAPPFGQPDKRVGYTSSYPAGVRENGGQYTHAAAWLAIALFEAGRPEDGTRVLRLLNTIAKYTDGLGEKYRGEPYALAGDVYANPACPGRVGWSQYTGAAGWMYTAVLRHLLGLRPRGNAMDLQPCLPVGWPGYSLKITLLNTPLSITVAPGGGQGADGGRQGGAGDPAGREEAQGAFEPVRGGHGSHWRKTQGREIVLAFHLIRRPAGPDATFPLKGEGFDSAG